MPRNHPDRVPHGRGAAAPFDDRIVRILERVQAIPRGSVSTYGDIDPVAPRLVGRVLASIDADVPWHRVVRANGTVAMGERQLELLRREGVPLRGNRVDLAAARPLSVRGRRRA